jgi:hypothetical protein
MSRLPNPMPGPDAPGRAPRARFERVVATLLLANGALALVTACARLLLASPPALAWSTLPWWALLGLLSGLLAVNGRVAGVCGGVLFHAVQVCAYFGYAHGPTFAIRSGLSLALVLRLPGGVLVVNVVALALLAAGVAVLVLRRAASARARRGAPGASDQVAPCGSDQGVPERAGLSERSRSSLPE